MLIIYVCLDPYECMNEVENVDLNLIIKYKMNRKKRTSKIIF